MPWQATYPLFIEKNFRETRGLHRLYCRIFSTIIYCFSRKCEYTGSTSLQMQLQLKNFKYISKPTSLPPGYLIRTYLEGDESDWSRIITASFDTSDFKKYGLPEIIIKNTITASDFDAQSIFFVTYNDSPTGTVGAVSMFVGWRKIGLVTWVAVSPEHRGKKLGLALTMPACNTSKREV
jgi:hypothetical protein